MKRLGIKIIEARALSLTMALIFAVVVSIPLSGPAIADSYQYDDLGRLDQVTYSDGSTITYTYDAAGNRTEVEYDCITSCTQLPPSGLTVVHIGGVFYVIPIP